MEEEIIYVVTDNGWDAWKKRATFERAKNLQKNTVYKGFIVNTNYIAGKNPEDLTWPWSSTYPPFRIICKIEAFVLTRGKIESIGWLP